jgi:hypothetical protein
MTGALFCLGLLLCAPVIFRKKAAHSPVLAKLLWLFYFGLGVSATLIAISDVLRPVFQPNYQAALFLTLCILIGIGGFLGFRARDVGHAIASIRSQGLIEGVLIGTQLCATLFFLPFAISSLIGDANENRLDLGHKMEMLGSYGIFNTVAGAACQLFGVSLVLAGVRLAQIQGRGRNVPRACVLIFASLSYVVYILAYVGRDGVVYWLMTALAVYMVFRSHLPAPLRRQIVTLGMTIGAFMLLPFIAITAARFVNTEHGSAWSILDYFGSQINNFGDYSTIDRPLTLGIMSFPMLIGAACSVTGLAGCENWDDLKAIIFDQYLAQGKEPWLFGTYVSDFVGDFGYLGTLVLVSVFALLCRVACRTHPGRRPMTIVRLLLVMFFFLVPYWGVFYFRFSIANGFIVVNLGFISFIWLLQKFGSRLPVPLDFTAASIRPSGRK